MRNKIILITFILLILLIGCSSINERGYILKEASGENWRFSGGELLFKGGEEEIKYSIDYIGNDEFEPFGLTFEFLIYPENSDNKNDINNAEHLHSNVNGYLNKKVNNKYSKKDSYKGELLDSEKEYNYDNLYLKISYEIDGTDYEEVIKLPMEKM